MSTMTSNISRSKRKRPALIESEDEDESTDKNVQGRANRRQSTRINYMRQKKTFRLPSRDEIWKDIPSVTSCKIKHITPRKTVNNFIKVYNDYNYDDYDEDSSDDEDASSESNSESEKDEVKRNKIKNYHKRIKQLPSSSDEDEVQVPSKEKASSEDKGTENNHIGATISGNATKDCTCHESANDSLISGANDSTDSDSSDVLSPSGKNTSLRKYSVIESDTDSEENTQHSEKSIPSKRSEDCADAMDSRSARLKQKHKMLFKSFQEAQEAMKNKKEKKET